MTSAEIRQSFLDFFKSKQHTVVPSSSLMPDSPNLLFTNAGMNQFVPIFLGERTPDFTRATDTQKCIRAGGKHNDLDDVGLDTYHHTFFEMLGNWSFGDYFKREAIEWAWELVVGKWKFPAERLYATVYAPDLANGDPAEFDRESYDLWAALFEKAGLDPKIHIVNGNKKDNFWMMGETGPCGPCSELHMDLTPAGDTRGALVNQGSAECIEIWNLVFIQFNANADGTFSPLPAKHVDTGMGFERVTSIIQNTKHFTDFTGIISNYETDIFRPIFDEIEKLSGKKYTSTLPVNGSTGETEQEKIDIAFRVIADHIRTLSFAISDGIQPGNTDRNYVLRRILRRAVRYGRTLGFSEPFFYKLVDVLAEQMGDVFPELRAKREHVKEVLKREEEAFNRTLDKGIALFEEEASRLAKAAGSASDGLGSVHDLRASESASGPTASGSARDSRAGFGDSPKPSTPTVEGAKYSKRRLPHFERPWGKYMVTFSTADRQPLSEPERDIVLDCILFPAKQNHYELYAACVMPDHVHVLFEPQIKSETANGEPVFYTLSELLQNIKSVSAHRLNKLREKNGAVWDKESFDRLIRSDADLEEKFLYVCKNPWDSGAAGYDQNYRWLWTQENSAERLVGGASGESPDAARGVACAPQGNARAPQGKISGAFAFRLYDEQGFPFDLTELMARERGLSVDRDGFEELMEEQRQRARAAQKKQIIELSQIETKTPTQFVGFDSLTTTATVQEVVALKDKTAVILDSSTAYAEMGGQVGDTGEMAVSGQIWQIVNTQKSGDTFLHFIEGGDAPAVGQQAEIAVSETRRRAIERHHSVTHLLHWALHEVVSREASQKGSFVGPDKLTFDFNSAALTPQQVADVEKLVNERILENSAVSWQELPFSEVKKNPQIMQFFGEKYGDVVRVVQIGGEAKKLDGYSMELCGGTHVRATGEIGQFRIVSESAVAAGVRRIEAVAGFSAREIAVSEHARLREIARKLGAPFAEIEKKVDALLSQQKDLEKSLKSLQQRQAADSARSLLAKAETVSGVPAIIQSLADTDGNALQAIGDALKSQFSGVVALIGTSGGGAEKSVSLMANVSPDFTAKIQAGKLIQQIAPIVGGKGGGRPDNARGAGKDATKIAEALDKAKSLLAENH